MQPVKTIRGPDGARDGGAAKKRRRNARRTEGRREKNRLGRRK